MEEQRPWDGSPLIISSLRDSYPPICAIQSSGLCKSLGLDHGGAGFLERTANGQLWESGQLQMDQIQQKIRIPSDMSIESLTISLLTSGLSKSLGLDHGGAGFLERKANGLLWEAGQLQMDQIQQIFRSPSNMPIESLSISLSTAGLCESLGLDHGGAGFLDRAANGQLWESGQLQMDQIQQKIRIPSNMSIESLTISLSTSGEYPNVHIKAFNYLNNERERSNVITINNKRKRSNVITITFNLLFENLENTFVIHVT